MNNICCQVLRINGIVTHEFGCREAHRSTQRDCKWCDSTFKPESRNQFFCDESCMNAYHGVNEDD